jgi:thiamine-monophosphate kinase
VTLPAGAVAAFHDAAPAASITVTGIGRLVAGEGTARLVDQRGKTLTFARPSFSHF